MTKDWAPRVRLPRPRGQIGSRRGPPRPAALPILALRRDHAFPPEPSEGVRAIRAFGVRPKLAAFRGGRWVEFKDERA